MIMAGTRGPSTTNRRDEITGNLTNKQRRVLARALWDLTLTPEEFLAIIKGLTTRAWPDRGFCVARLLESANWFEICDIVHPEDICRLWGDARKYVRSNSIREGMDFACRTLR